MAKGKLKIVGFTISITFLAFIFLSIFSLTFYMKFSPLIEENLNIFFYGSLVMVLIFIITGAITIKELGNKLA